MRNSVNVFVVAMMGTASMVGASVSTANSNVVHTVQYGTGRLDVRHMQHSIETALLDVRHMQSSHVHAWQPVNLGTSSRIHTALQLRENAAFNFTAVTPRDTVISRQIEAFTAPVWTRAFPIEAFTSTILAVKYPKIDLVQYQTSITAGVVSLSSNIAVTTNPLGGRTSFGSLTLEVPFVVPEPASLGLVALTGVVGLSRRRR